jgi:hypothetical protein
MQKNYQIKKICREISQPEHHGKQVILKLPRISNQKETEVRKVESTIGKSLEKVS